MRLTCPGCGLVASAEAWANDAACREAFAEIVNLPPAVAKVALPYMSLFRPAKTALTWTKAHRLLKELRGLVEAGHVQVSGKVARPCSPQMWAMAIEEMLARRDRLDRSLPNHNYLRQVAHGLADRADSQAETRRNQDEASGSYRRDTGSELSTVMDPIKAYALGLTDKKPGE